MNDYKVFNKIIINYLKNVIYNKETKTSEN